MPLKDSSRNDQREAFPAFPAPMDPFLRAVNPLAKEGGAVGERSQEKQFLDLVTYTYGDDRPEAFRERREWLIGRFGLKQPRIDSHYDPDMKALLEDPGSARAKDVLESRRNLMQYEDDSVYPPDGVWTMTATHTGGMSRLLFYYSMEGRPDKSGTDALTDALRLFAEKYKPTTISYRFLGNEVSPDYDALLRGSKYSVKRH